MRIRSVVLNRRPFSNRTINLGLASSIFAILLFCPAAIPQMVIDVRSGLIYFTEGDVYVDGPAAYIPIATQNYPLLKEGQVIRTGKGRAEIQLGPAVFMRLGGSGSLRMVKNHVEDAQVELLKGSVVIEVVKMTKGNKIQIQYATTSTEFKGTGVYRFDTNPPKLRVYGGTAEVSSADRKVALGSGRSVNLSSNLSVTKFSVKRTDKLHLWAARRSFFLFISNPEALKSQSNWEIFASGWATNRDFHIGLFSPAIAQEYAGRKMSEQNDKASFQSALDYLKYLDEVNRAKTSQEIQEQQQREQQQPQNKKQ